jgi:hypothetical protein
MGEVNKVNQENKTKIFLTAGAYVSLAAVIVYIVFINVPDTLLYAKKGILRWLPYLLIFGGLPYSIFKAMQLFYPRYNYVTAVALLFFIGPFFGIQLNRFDQLALERDGLITKGIITKKYEFKPSNRGPEWLIQATFKANGQEYQTFPQEDENNSYRQGEELDIIYSVKNPEINMLHYKYMEATE